MSTPIPAGSSELGTLMNAAYSLINAAFVQKSRFSDRVWDLVVRRKITPEAFEQIVRVMDGRTA